MKILKTLYWSSMRTRSPNSKDSSLSTRMVKYLQDKVPTQQLSLSSSMRLSRSKWRTIKSRMMLRVSFKAWSPMNSHRTCYSALDITQHRCREMLPLVSAHLLIAWASRYKWWTHKWLHRQQIWVQHRQLKLLLWLGRREVTTHLRCNHQWPIPKLSNNRTNSNHHRS